MKFRTLILFTGIFISFVRLGVAQGFSGNWDGYLISYSGGQEYTFVFKMVIITDGEGNCEGQTALDVEADGETYRAIYDFTGTYSGNSLSFEEHNVIESSSPSDNSFYWCTKSGTLYKDGQTITGKVTGYSPLGNCLPADVELYFDSELGY